MPDSSQHTGPRRIAVTGGRDFDDEGTVVRTFSSIGLSRHDTVVHGACRGCDLLCERIAFERFHAETEAIHADWQKYGKAAGPIRNREILKSDIDMLVAFPGGRGTANCIKQAIGLGIPICFSVPDGRIDDVAKAVGA